MKKNLGTVDRLGRSGLAVALGVCSVVAPLPVSVRLAGFGALALYFALTALIGSCLGYRLLGMSTCAVER